MRSFLRARTWILVFSFLGMLSGHTKGQLVVTTGIPPAQLVNNVLIGQGVSASNVVFTGAGVSIGQFANGWLTNLGLDEGIIISTGDLTATPPVGSPVTQFASTGNGTGSNPLLAALIPGYTINDAAVLEFDFIPESDTIKFRFVFGSEEYPEFVSTSFNDVFGFFISGPKPAPLTGNYVNENIALIPGTSLPVTIDNVNNVTPSYPQYYVDNQGLSGMTIVYDGFTVVLTAWAKVVPCMTYHIVIAIGDAGDSAYDSAVFLEKGSFTSTSVSVATNYTNPKLNLPYAVEGCQDAIVSFKVPFARYDSAWIHIDSIYGTAINGVDYIFVIDSVLIPPGHTSGNLTITPILDNIPEGIEYIFMKVRTSVCNASDTVLIIPIIDYTSIQTVSTPDTMVCGLSAQIEVQAFGGAPPYHYIWTPYEGLNDPNLPNPTATPLTTTRYYVEVWDTTGCSMGLDSVLITVNPAPLISFMPDIYEGCDPVTVQFTHNVQPNAQTFYWDFGDGTNTSLENPQHTFYYHPDTVWYNVSLTATTPEGCTETYQVKKLIKVHPMPVADFEGDPDSTNVREPDVQFNNFSSPYVTTWYWDFGDPESPDNTSTLESPMHSFVKPGDYTVFLEVKTAYGCWDTISRVVKVIDVMEDSLVFPNVFTPNGDGINDRFVIDKLEPFYYLGRDLIVYNRWGKKVYESSGYMNEWDGAGVPDGTYFYIFRYTFYFLEEKTAKEVSGVVTILR
ncbi:MAG TPA: choice-of-anchor L domain-containing protein [Bacteroidales bacterium]|nr:choice-of-anchor L domain-containing protein [Bacteroidales bacterium]